ncbi:MAG: hypothetical protein IPP66_04555 [Anaerolineales bacterium]|nr:hypothetical protein [Anaerolineales bacterium]
MESLGINLGLLFAQVIFFVLFVGLPFVGLPLIALIGLAKKKMSGVPLALWVLIICAIPVLGAVAYWIVKPTAESKI